jgi:diacylglycerol kinase family enzyme
MDEFIIIIILITQVIIFHKLKKIIKMTAQETLEAFVIELQTAKEAIIARIEAIIAGGGDLTAQEVTDLLTPIVTDLENIGTPPSA